MKKRILFILLALGLFISANAQYSYRYSVLRINKHTFSIKYTESDGTCEIVDENYKLDDRKFALTRTRSIKGITKVNGMRIIEIPSEVSIGGKTYTLTSIGRAAFAGYTNVDEVMLPASITNIADHAFFASSIKQIVIPGSVTRIGDRAFGKCKNLTSITMPRDIETGKDLYAESKNCNVNYSVAVVRDYVAARKEKKQNNESVADEPMESDVDINIPTNPADNANTFAIIIANENYVTEDGVKFALQDGRTFRDYCSKVLGVPSKHIRYRENATLNNMVQDFSWMSSIAEAYEGQARFIVYYAGHGIPDESTGAAYLLPTDGSGGNISTGYSLNTLYKQFGELNAENVTVFLDACFSGSQRGGEMLASTRGFMIKPRINAPTGNMVVFSAAQGDQTAWPYDDMGHGLFTYYLLKKLKESNGKATLSEIGDYVTQNVKRYSIVINDKLQTPSVSVSNSLTNKWKNIRLR